MQAAPLPIPSRNEVFAAAELCVVQSGFLGRHVEQIAARIHLDLHHPAIRIEPDFAGKGRIDRLGFGILQPDLEQPAGSRIVEKTLRCRPIERFGAKSGPLPDEDRAGFAAPLRRTAA